MKDKEARDRIEALEQLWNELAKEVGHLGEQIHKLQMAEQAKKDRFRTHDS